MLSVTHEVLCERKKGQSIVVMSQNVHFMAIGIDKSSWIHSWRIMALLYTSCLFSSEWTDTILENLQGNWEREWRTCTWHMLLNIAQIWYMSYFSIAVIKYCGKSNLKERWNLDIQFHEDIATLDWKNMAVGKKAWWQEQEDDLSHCIWTQKADSMNRY